MSTNFEYATPRDWRDAMNSAPRYKLHEIIERLGLKANWASNKRGKTNFESPLVKDLVADMTDIIANLPKEPDELVKQLSVPDSLQKEVDELMSKHGVKIWGRVGDRDHLVTAEGGGFYPRDLFFEEEEDRMLIRVLLHWWMGQRACNQIVARERIARDRRKKEERKKMEQMQRDGALYEGMVEGVGPKEFFKRTASPGHELHRQPHLLPQQTFTEPLRYYPVPASASSHEPLSSLTTELPTRPLVTEKGNFVASFLRESTSSTSASPVTFQPGISNNFEARPAGRGLDMDTLHALRTYLYPHENGPKWDEDMLLHRIETIWRESVRTRQIDDPTLFAARDLTFLTWIELRRHIAELEELSRLMTSLGWHEEADLGRDVETEILTQRKALMSASRGLVHSWGEIGKGLRLARAPNLSADELLVQAFIVLAGDSNTSDMSWSSVDVAEIIRWLDEELHQFDLEEEEDNRQSPLFFVAQ